MASRRVRTATSGSPSCWPARSRGSPRAARSASTASPPEKDARARLLPGRGHPLVHRGLSQQDRADPTPASQRGVRDEMRRAPAQGKGARSGNALAGSCPLHAWKGHGARPAYEQARRGQSSADRQHDAADWGQDKPAARLRSREGLALPDDHSRGARIPTRGPGPAAAVVIAPTVLVLFQHAQATSDGRHSAVATGTRCSSCGSTETARTIATNGATPQTIRQSTSPKQAQQTGASGEQEAAQAKRNTKRLPPREAAQQPNRPPQPSRRPQPSPRPGPPNVKHPQNYSTDTRWKCSATSWPLVQAQTDRRRAANALSPATRALTSKRVSRSPSCWA